VFDCSARNKSALAAEAGAEDLKGGRHRYAEPRSGLTRPALQEFGGIEEFPSQTVNVGLVSGQRRDAKFEGLGRFHGMPTLG
jgi:hypothetical protein